MLAGESPRNRAAGVRASRASLSQPSEARGLIPLKMEPLYLVLTHFSVPLT